MPLASIIIPVFNGSDQMEDAIQSALRQNFSDFEILIVDNASTDNTLYIASKYSSFPNVSVHAFSENVSMPANFNRSLEIAQGEFVRFLCHDDLLEANCLRYSIAALKTNETSGIATSYERSFGDQFWVRDEKVVGCRGLVSGSVAREGIVRRGNWIGGPSAVTLRMSALPAKLFRDDLNCSFDVEAWLSVLRSWDLFVIPEVLFRSRIHAHQASSICARGGFIRDWDQILKSVNHGATKSQRVSRKAMASSYIRNQLAKAKTVKFKV